MKKIALILAITMLAITSIPVLAQEVLPPDPTLTGRFTAEPAGEFIIFDALILRPLGLVSMGVGAVGAAASAPWAASSNSQDRVNRELLQKPYWYTFCRPLGDIDF
jgi:hypothetical protein